MTQYDIYFDPKSSKWKIRMVYMHFWLWSTTTDLTGRAENTDEKATPLEFGDFGAAEAYAHDVGLAFAYDRRHPTFKVSFAEVAYEQNKKEPAPELISYRPHAIVQGGRG